MRKLRANLFLLLAALFWGATFVAQRVGANYLSPFAFQAIRCLLSSAILFPLASVFDRFGKKGTWKSKALWIGGSICGLMVFLATNLQQYGMSFGTTAGKSGFITALYIIFVPILGLFMKKKPGFLVWVSVPVAVVGLYLLCMNEALQISPGDAVTLACPLFCCIHILATDHYSTQVDAVRLCCTQFLIAGSLSAIAACFAPLPTLSELAACAIPLGYAVIFSSVIAYVLQVLGQKNTDPTIASLLMSMEAVFACLSGWLILNEHLTTREAIGCGLMLCAVILAQLPSKHMKS